MSNFVPFSRDQAFLLPPDLRSWIPADDVVHFVVAAVERVPLGSFQVPERTGGKPQYHPRLMLVLLIYCYSQGIFSSRRIERATHRDVAVRFVAANLHPDHDTIAAFRAANKTAFEAAFLQVLLVAREATLLQEPEGGRTTPPVRLLSTRSGHSSGVRGRACGSAHRRR